MTNSSTVMIEESILKKKAQRYLLCFLDRCPLHEHCLHWQAGHYAPASKRVINSINPTHRENCTEHCIYYRDDTVKRVARGMVGFFREMPHYKELAIKGDIIDYFSRTRFYRMRKGTLPITPADQEAIAAICQYHGWTAEPQYDAYEEEYVW